MVLLAAEGLPNAEIARRIGMSRQTVMGWRDRYEWVVSGRCRTCRAAGDRRRWMRARSWWQRWPRTAARRPVWGSRTGRLGCWPPSWRSRSPRWPGSGASGTCSLGAPRRSSSAPTGAGRQDPRRRRAVSGPAGEGGRALRRREVPGPGVGPDRPILPIMPGVAERQTHDYIRHGTTTLFAALEVATGRVEQACLPRHRHQEFLAVPQTGREGLPEGQAAPGGATTTPPTNTRP